MKRFMRWLFGPSKQELLEQIAKLRLEVEDAKFDKEFFMQSVYSRVESSDIGNHVRDAMRSVNFGPILDKAITTYVANVVKNINFSGKTFQQEVESNLNKQLLNMKVDQQAMIDQDLKK